MKLSFSFVLCSALIYAAICANVAAEDSSEEKELDTSDGSVDDETCIVDYLKSKGKLENDFPSPGKASSLCRFNMMEVIRITRELIKKPIGEEMPNGVDCFMAEYEKQNTVDVVLTIAAVRVSDSLTKAEVDTRMVGLKNEYMEHMKTIAGACKFDEESFLELFEKVFEVKEETEATTQTA